MPQLSFGPGAAWGERVDVTGSGIGPRQFGIMQDISVDYDFTDKELYGQFQFPVALARGQGKIAVKIKEAQLINELFGDVFFGLSSTVGQVGIAQDEANNIPASTPWQVTVSNAATFTYDLGVKYALTGLGFSRVTSPSGAGQYSVNQATGVYTFSTADANAAVLISYRYGITTSGSLLTITNQLQGTTPIARVTFYQKISPPLFGQTVTSRPLALVFNACVASKLSLATKIDDWTIPEIDLSAYADASGTIGYLSTVE